MAWDGAPSSDVRRAMRPECGVMGRDAAPRRRLDEMTGAQIFKRATEFAAKARAADTHGFARDAYHRLAIRYAILSAEREIEEGRPAGC
jgi:hypothetical protein